MIKHEKKTEKKLSAEELIKILIKAGIDRLSTISRWIKYNIKFDQKISNATAPDVRYYSPIFQPCPYISWNIFRDGRKARSNPQTFGLAYIDSDSLRQRGCFKIIQDDCDDMINVLKNVDALSPSLTESLISSINEIVGRYYYMAGYHGLKYLEREKAHKTIKEKREDHKRLVKASAIKMFNQFTLPTVKNNISEAAFVNMIKDDLSPLKMSEKKIKTLLHELQDEEQIKFDPRKTKSGKM